MRRADKRFGWARSRSPAPASTSAQRIPASTSAQRMNSCPLSLASRVLKQEEITSALRPRGQCRAAAAAAVAAESQGELKAMTLKTGIGNQEKSHVIAS